MARFGFTQNQLAFAIFALFFLLCYLIDSQICLTVFAGVLLAIGLCRCAHFVAEKTNLSYQLSLGAILLLLLLAFGLFAVFLYPQITSQLQQFIGELPELSEKSVGFLQQQLKIPVINDLVSLERLGKSSTLWSSIGKNIMMGLTAVVGAASAAIVVAFLGLFLAFEPSVYRRGFRKIFPADLRDGLVSYQSALGDGLFWWLVGRLTSMLVVGVLTFIGLSVIGVKNALAFGFITAVLSFIPLIGPLLSLLPPLAVSLAQNSAESALSIIGLYAAVQFLESYMITPFVQKRATSLPPALGLLAIITLSKFDGILGTIMATPTAVYFLVLFQTRNKAG